MGTTTEASRLRPEVAETFLSKYGYKLVALEWPNKYAYVSFICPKGHSGRASWNNFQQGRSRCLQCEQEQRAERKLNEFRSMLSAEGYVLLAEQYRHSLTREKVKCPFGHDWEVSWTQFKTHRHRCPTCYHEGRVVPLEDVLSSIATAGYRVLGGQDTYVDTRSLLTVQCPKGHLPYDVRAYSFRNGDRCPRCAMRTSAADTEIFDFVKQYDPLAIRGSRKLLEGKMEIDVYSPTTNVGVEHNGLFWHSESNGKDDRYHVDKLEMAAKKGIRLLNFFEDEWRDRRHLVEAMIAKALGAKQERKFARKCSIREVDVTERRTFFESSHLAGDASAAVSFGLWDGNDLLQVLSVRRSGFTGGEPTFEIARFATKPGLVVVGGLSRLTSAACSWVKEQGGDYLYTYADRRFSTGDAYRKSGFEFVKVTPPCYWYVKQGKRVHRYTLRKTHECPAEMTEREWRASQGWIRLWDCGHLLFRTPVTRS